MRQDSTTKNRSQFPILLDTADHPDRVAQVDHAKSHASSTGGTFIIAMRHAEGRAIHLQLGGNSCDNRANN